MSNVFFISGKAQHGKNYLADKIKDYLESQNKKVCIIAYADMVKHVASKYFNWAGQKDKERQSFITESWHRYL